MTGFFPYLFSKARLIQETFKCPKSCCACDHSKLLNVFRLFFTCTDLKYPIWNTYVYIKAQFSQKECWQSLVFGKKDLGFIASLKKKSIIVNKIYPTK